jgi:hypothetical protein
MTENSESRISAFAKDVQRVAEEVEHLGEDSRLVGEEVVGAEILLTKELTEKIGIVWETAERAGAIGTEQIRHFIEDYLATAREFSETPGLHNFLDLTLNHLGRRITHVSEGARAVADLVAEESGRLEDAVLGVWKPFLAVLNRDWESRS